MRGSPQYREESTAWLYQEAPGSLPSRLHLRYSIFQVALIVSERHIKELLWTIHSVTLISKQTHEPSKPTKQTPNPVFCPQTQLFTTQEHTSHHTHQPTEASVSIQSQTLPQGSSSPSILSSPSRYSHRFQVLWRTCSHLIKYWLECDYTSADFFSPINYFAFAIEICRSNADCLQLSQELLFIFVLKVYHLSFT